MSSADKREKMALIVERDGSNCCLCGDPVNLAIYGQGPVAPTLEHIVPKSRGGANRLFNLALAHKVCNERRGNSPLAREASVPALCAVQCNHCGAPFSTIEEVDAHRFNVHGFLSPRWEITTLAVIAGGKAQAA